MTGARIGPLGDGELTEDDLIATLFAPMAGQGGLGLRDDVALLDLDPTSELVITADALVAGVHFFPDDPPVSIARKALGVNLSDLASKAAAPVGYTLSLALPGGWTRDWLEGFAAGLRDGAAGTGCALLGGDTVKTPGPLTLSITAFGTVPRGSLVPRTGARPGDRLFVSGTIGDAALGLRLRLDPAWGSFLASGDRDHLLDRYLHPQPRLALRSALRACAHGGMDVSDGLVGDLVKMMRVSGASARVDLARVPLSDAARAAMRADPGHLLTAAVTGGDDYEVLATVPRDRADMFCRLSAEAGVGVTCIGDVVAGTEPPFFLGIDGKPLTFARGSYSHF